MNRIEFNESISRLQNVYGEKKYPLERIEGFWGSFAKIDASVFKRAISLAIEKEKTAPLDDQIRKYVSAAQSVGDYGTKQKTGVLEDFGFRQSLSCPQCRGNGFVLLKRDGLQGAFACLCINGRAQKEYAEFQLEKKMAEWKKSPSQTIPWNTCLDAIEAHKNGWSR